MTLNDFFRRTDHRNRIYLIFDYRNIGVHSRSISITTYDTVEWVLGGVLSILYDHIPWWGGGGFKDCLAARAHLTGHLLLQYIYTYQHVSYQ